MKIIADLHTHTLASSHAYSTIRENCEIAKERGIKVIALTDHAPLMPDAPHEWHAANQQILPQVIKGVCVLKGIEADIMNTKGELDIPDYVVGKLQWIVASFHGPVFPPMSEEDHLLAIENVCKNPMVDVFAHLTATGYPFDYKEAAKLFSKYDKIVELNEASLRSGASKRENAVRLFNECKSEGVKIAIDSDAHYCERIGDFSAVLDVLKEVKYPEELIISTDLDYIITRANKNHPSAPKIDNSIMRI